MEYNKPAIRPVKNPESKIYEDLKDHLEYHGWFVQNIHGNKFQNGLPDMFISHHKHGGKWVELKTPARAREKFGGLNDAQLKKFPKMCNAGCQIYILTRVEDWTRLFGPPNWRAYAIGGSKQRPIGF